MKKFAVVFLSSLLASICSSVEAAENRQDGGSTFNSEIFSLSKKKESAFDAPSATYVLSSEDIRRSGATSIPEALRMVPGLQVARMDGNKWAITARGFNRQFSNKLLVMIDGRTVYTTLFSGTVWDIQDYVIEDIDRIEVVKGPGGTIWGANAVNGVINIITKSAAQTQGAYVSQIIGNQDKSITEARYGGETASKDAYRFYVKKAVRDGLNRADNGQSNRDGIRQDRAGFRYDISSIKDSSITIHGDAFSGTAQNYFTTLSNPTKNDKDSRGGNLVVNWNKKLSNKSNFILNSYFDYDQFKIPILQRSARTFDVDFQNFYNFSKENQFIWGVGYRQISDDINESDVNGNLALHYASSHRNDQLFTAFVQDKIGLIPDKLYLTLGTKVEKNDFTGFEYQPNARLSYYPARNQTLWAAVSRSVRTPTRGESDLTIRTGSSDQNVGALAVSQGSPTYGIEQLIGYEAGYRIRPTSKTLIDLSAFYNDYSKLRTLEAKSSSGFSPVVSNLGYGESYGFELTGKWQVMDSWKLELNYERLDIFLHVSPASNDAIVQVLRESDNLENAEGQSPRDQIKLKSFYNITPKVEFDNIFYYVGGLNKGNGNNERGVSSYVNWDTRLGYLMTRNLDLSIGVRNLMNQIHSEFKGALYNRQTEIGRTFYFKMAWQY